MPEYELIECDPEIYQNQIRELWKINLPKTSPQRLTWLQNGNPAGKTVWIFALEKRTKKICGTLSIIPRIFYSDKEIKGGMLSDFMVDLNHRAFGPAIILQKYAMQHFSLWGFDFLYTIPEQRLNKFFKNLGFQKIGNLIHLVKPLHSENYIKKYIGLKLSCKLAPIIDNFLSIKKVNHIPEEEIQVTISRESKFPIEGDRLKIFPIDFTISSDCSQKFFAWRKLSTHLNTCYFLELKRKDFENISGFAMLEITEKKATLLDIILSKDLTFEETMKNIILHLQTTKCDAIYFKFLGNKQIILALKKFGFLNAKNDSTLYFYGNQTIAAMQWFFTWNEKLL